MANMKIYLANDGGFLIIKVVIYICIYIYIIYIYIIYII